MSEQNEQAKPKHNEVEFPPDRVKFYEAQAQRLLDAHGREFHEFIKGHEKLEAEGDRLICLGEGTGYNIILADEDMPLTSKKDLIFYNNYIGRAHHFGLLLANMEAKGIITPDIIRFGKKATKVLYGGWELDESNEFKEVITFDVNATKRSKEVERTVETVAIFSPKTKEQAVKIAKHLLDYADKDKGGYIDGSWEVPDIRATLSLANILVRSNQSDFRVVVANIREVNAAQLIVLRQNSRFDDMDKLNNPTVSWVSKDTGQNTKLAWFLTNDEVRP